MDCQARVRLSLFIMEAVLGRDVERSGMVRPNKKRSVALGQDRVITIVE